MERTSPIYRLHLGGGTLEETEQSIREAIEGHLEVMREHGESIPEPTTPYRTSQFVSRRETLRI
jgi:predicted RNase H-like HicB family nuclease